MRKNYKIRPEDIKNVAVGYGSCIATDMITVEGNKIGYAVREEPSHKTDSGWVFMSGLESQEYMDNAENMTIYDVNTIANYDPEIIKIIESPIGSQFEKDNSGKIY
ncbi:MAG: DUF2185 domain-containing protein [Pseudomonadota bacterium]|nr:DUF2185 domain-containing protein [Pseudomonadota bacterium]